MPVSVSKSDDDVVNCEMLRQVAETVRQLRGEAGERQVDNLEFAMTSLAQTNAAHPMILARGEAA